MMNIDEIEYEKLIFKLPLYKKIAIDCNKFIDEDSTECEYGNYGGEYEYKVHTTYYGHEFLRHYYRLIVYAYDKNI